MKLFQNEIFYVNNNRVRLDMIKYIEQKKKKKKKKNVQNEYKLIF